jgi:NADH dehydrogenase (ubiquinone) 1 beta subcomplex subunit 3
MAGPALFRDAWAKREAWRKHPVFARTTMVRSAFPGFGIGLVAFAGFVVVDNVLGIGKKHDDHH